MLHCTQGRILSNQHFLSNSVCGFRCFVVFICPSYFEMAQLQCIDMAILSDIFLSLVGIVGALFVSLYLSLQIGRNKIVEFLSNNTFTLFATEVVWGWNLHRLELVTSMVMSPFLKVILQFVMGGVFAYLLNRFTPVLFGKKKS